LTRITGRSTCSDETGRKWQANDFVLSTLLETHDWKDEPMVLISLGQLIEQLGLGKGLHSYGFGIGGETLRRDICYSRSFVRRVCDLAVSHEQTRR